MKRSKMFLVPGFFLVMTFVASYAFAQDMGGMMGDEVDMGEGPMHGGGMGGQMMGGKGKDCQMMMKGMMEKSMVVLPDGSIVVLVGNKLIKYNKDLVVVKEAEIKVDMEAMQKDMKGMMKMCPMGKGKMGAGEEPKAPPATE